MRTALISAQRKTPAGGLRAAKTLVGRSVLEWQVDLGLSLGCQRVICLCDGANETINTVQRRVESGGFDFHAIRTNIQLLSLVRTEDELLILLDGLVVDPDAAIALTDRQEGPGRFIATLPNGHALAEAYPNDFERIDRENHWAGIAVMQARQMHKLGDFEPDSDPVSLLLRLALQDRVSRIDWSAQPAGASLLMSGDESALAKRESEMVLAGSEDLSWLAPGNALAQTIVARLAPKGLHSGPEMGAGAAVVLALLGLALASLEMGLAGLCSVSLAAFVASYCKSAGILRERLWSIARSRIMAEYLPLVIETLTIGVVILALGSAMGMAVQVALPVLSMGCISLAARGQGNAFGAFWCDRTLHLVILTAGLAAGYLAEALAALGLAALIALRVRPLKH